MRWRLEHNDEALEWELDSYHHMYDGVLNGGGIEGWELGAGSWNSGK